MHNEHTRLVQAIRDRKPDQARIEMEQQIEHSKRKVLDILKHTVMAADYEIHIRSKGGR